MINHQSSHLSDQVQYYSKKTALVLVNPHARQVHQKLSKALDYLQTLGLNLIQESAEDIQDYTHVIQRYKDQVELVIVGGGDGTLNAAVDGLVGTQLPLGILPLGTANDLARTLKIPIALPEACRVIAAGYDQSIDLGWVNGKHFFNVASLGLSVDITDKLTKETKRRWGIFAYGITAIRVICSARPFHAEIQFDGGVKRVKTLQIAIGNGQYYGGGMKIAHDATINDQRLDLCSLEIKQWWQILTVLIALWTGRHGKQVGSRTLSGSEFHIYTHKPYSINTDGDLTVTTPAHFRVIPSAIRVITPAPVNLKAIS
jgi:YegS/Rv2252/BmrU family lipid kinase